MIRDKAKETGSKLARDKLATIVTGLGVVLRRYKLSRKERHNIIQGEIVPGDSGD